MVSRRDASRVWVENVVVGVDGAPNGFSRFFTQEFSPVSEVYSLPEIVEAGWLLAVVLGVRQLKRFWRGWQCLEGLKKHFPSSQKHYFHSRAVSTGIKKADSLENGNNNQSSEIFLLG